MCLVIGGDHGKGFFTMLMTLYIEVENWEKAYYIDEVVGEIDSTEDKVEILRPLAKKLEESFMRCNISSVTGNMPIIISSHKETTNKKVFFGNTLNNSDFTILFRYDIECNVNSDLKYNFMTLGRSGYEKA